MTHSKVLINEKYKRLVKNEFSFLHRYYRIMVDVIGHEGLFLINGNALKHHLDIIWICGGLMTPLMLKLGYFVSQINPKVLLRVLFAFYTKHNRPFRGF